jgi:hypothetical protein
VLFFIPSAAVAFGKVLHFELSFGISDFRLDTGTGLFSCVCEKIGEKWLRRKETQRWTLTGMTILLHLRPRERLY